MSQAFMVACNLRRGIQLWDVGEGKFIVEFFSKKYKEKVKIIMRKMIGGINVSHDGSDVQDLSIWLGVAGSKVM